MGRARDGLRALFPAVVVRRFWLPLFALMGVGELGARLLDASPCEAIVPDARGWDSMIGDSRYLWKLEPNRRFESPNAVTQTNAVGLRTSLLPEDPKGAGELRVVVTGDSTIFGWGVPDGETYAELLELELDRAISDRRVRVINLGVPGYSTEQTLLLLEDLGWSYQPDLLVVHNLFSDSNIDAFQDRDALRLANPENSPVYRSLHRSRLYCAAYMPLARFQAQYQQESDRVLMPGRPPDADDALALESVDALIDLSRVPLDDYVENLERMAQQATEHGAQMVLAPLAQEWDVGLWRHPGVEPPGPTDLLPWQPHREAARRVADDRGLAFVDVPEAFAQAPGEPALLFIDQMHPSAWGAQVLARAVADAVRERPDLLGLEGGIPPAAPLSPPATGGPNPAPDQLPPREGEPPGG